MKHLRYGLGVYSIAVVMGLSMLARPAQAEFVGELYGGGSFTNKADATDSSSLGATFTFHGVKFDTSGTVGGRVGYWFDQVGSIGAFGVGLDVFTFRANVDQQNVPVSVNGFNAGTAQINPVNISTVGIGFDVLRFRLHLAKSDEFKNGRVQPYVSVGPAVFITKTSDTGNFAPPDQSSTHTALGVKAGAGLNVHITPLLSLFGEYRFTHFTTEASFRDTTPPASQETFKTDLNTHHLVGGISFHF